MKNYGFIKVINITLESTSAIEKIVNKAIGDFNKQKIKILDLQITEDNIYLVLERLWLVVQQKMGIRLIIKLLIAVGWVLAIAYYTETPFISVDWYQIVN